MSGDRTRRSGGPVSTQAGTKTTARAATETDGAPPGTTGVSGAGPIIRLNPADGLFLKAEHLEQMQEYAAALSAAVGIATGAGVVYGFGVTLRDGALVAGSGLALTPTGRPLQTDEPLELPLDADHMPSLDRDDFWLVLVEPDSDLTGAENMYGTICTDPCEGTGVIKPWRRSLVRLRLSKDTMSDLGNQEVLRRRGWLASQYFERERREGNPWLVPRIPGGGVSPPLDRPWDEEGARPVADAVPLGVLLWIDGAPVLDTWTARREVSGPPGDLRWAGHLAMRPWQVFLAQVRQFEDQLKGEPISELIVSKQQVIDRRARLVNDFIATHPVDTSIGRQLAFKTFASTWQQAPAPYTLQNEGRTLWEMGFTELPPAGYLSERAGGPIGRDRLAALFQGIADLRFCDVRADYVAGAVQAAQHLDRIPLQPGNDPRPAVDILVPSRPADLEALRTDAYRWVAFVRRSEASCADAADKTEDVELALCLPPIDDALAKLATGERPVVDELAVIAYAEASAALPPGTSKPAVLDGLDIFGVIAAAPTAAQEELAGQRAETLSKAWQLDRPITTVVGPGLAWPLIVVVGQPGAN